MSNSEVTNIYDAATSFRAPGLAAVTADADVGVLALDKLVNVRRGSNRNKLGAETYKIVIVVSAVDKSSADETYAFVAKTGAVGAETVVVGTLPVSTTGQYVLILDTASIEKVDAAHASLKLSLDVGGITPSITFTAWMV